jgi:hypothetical protein
VPEFKLSKFTLFDAICEQFSINKAVLSCLSKFSGYCNIESGLPLKLEINYYITVLI